MAWHPMKPETLARRAAERAKEQEEASGRTFARMCERAAEDGPDGFFAEYLGELLPALGYPDRKEAPE